MFLYRFFVNVNKRADWLRTKYALFFKPLSQLCTAMAVGKGISHSYNLVLMLSIYLILGGITFKYERINATISNLVIIFISNELASQQQLFIEICRKRKS